MSASSSLATTVAHVVSILTKPLLKVYPPATIVKLQLVLEANLTALYAQSWDVSDPLRGSGRRCLSLSPDCLPPRAVYAACIAAGVQWFDWIALLGGRPIDLFVDPGCVSMRLDCKGPDSRIITVWADEVPSPTRAPAKSYAAVAEKQCKKTLAQQLLEEDAESDDQIFSMIADEICAPTWMTPMFADFPDKPRSLSPLSAISSHSSHSRSSSRSSNSSAGFSVSSASSSASRASSKPRDENEHPTLSRRERARQARVFIDTTKTEVTPYDGGKTTVLTGGVMLGGNAKKAAPRHESHSHGWRTPLRI
ncbi:hypothetical protein GGX14DRAFT_641265 [Mycena pura]|uniref:Anti-proliferative protein domain-containing protein n=1 Tax=Mycena pura TaxID=153505 RepID=A0AAD6YPW5_9AGAR|nr:hypothetical protein GGX14DRAFT_641265 [Mycena pura]